MVKRTTTYGGIQDFEVDQWFTMTANMAKKEGKEWYDESIMDKADSIITAQRDKRQAKKDEEKRITEMRKAFKKEAQATWIACWGKAKNIDNKWINEQVDEKMKEATK
jgi:hypothetical protein